MTFLDAEKVLSGFFADYENVFSFTIKQVFRLCANSDAKNHPNRLADTTNATTIEESIKVQVRDEPKNAKGGRRKRATTYVCS